jgi:hypothetical protein
MNQCVYVGDIEFACKAKYGLVVFLFLLTLLPRRVDSTPVTRSMHVCASSMPNFCHHGDLDL